MKLTQYFFTILILTLSINCFSINFQKKDIISNQWAGESIRIAELDPEYKKQHHFNRVFSKFSSILFISFLIVSSSVPIPLIADKEPPNTWYNPL